MVIIGTGIITTTMAIIGGITITMGITGTIAIITTIIICTGTTGTMRQVRPW
jgi:hypothetical protein